MSVRPLEAPGLTQFRWFEQTDSTNARALDWIRSGAEDGAVIVADAQTAGRGRRGRAWHSPAACNLYLSTVIHCGLSSMRLLPLVGALAVRETVTAFIESRHMTRIKWPNDVLVDNMKIAGVLVEGPESPKIPACVLGLGINANVRVDQLPPDLRWPATSLLQIREAPVERQALLDTLLDALALWISSWRSNPDRIAPALAAHCMTLGRRVRVSSPGQPAWLGQASSLDGEGRLLVQDDHNIWRKVEAGDVEPADE